ncbi:hypothetical protein BC826DRAFT_451695 [Russula brevipes]|nr:hypothetical protein BC826DRAFT_451695 [Russula brevipes]
MHHVYTKNPDRLAVGAPARAACRTHATASKREGSNRCQYSTSSNRFSENYEQPPPIEHARLPRTAQIFDPLSPVAFCGGLLGRPCHPIVLVLVIVIDMSRPRTFTT